MKIDSSLSSESTSPNNIAPKEISPVFLQFLDCLYQLWKQYPMEFEFDERLLDFLFVNSYSCRYGNFLFNNQKEMKEFCILKNGQLKNISQSTESIWKYINQNKTSFLNQYYHLGAEAAESPQEGNSRILYPSSQDLVYWPRIYLGSIKDDNNLQSSPENKPLEKFYNVQEIDLKENIKSSSTNIWVDDKRQDFEANNQPAYKLKELSLTGNSNELLSNPWSL